MSTQPASENRADRQTRQHAALTRLIVAFDAIEKEYTLGVDANGALIIQIVGLPSSCCSYGRPEGRIREEFFKRFGDALNAEAEWVDGYIVDIDHGVARVDHTADAIISAGLSPRPGRFQSREEAEQWYAAPRSNGNGALKEDAYAALKDFCALYATHESNFEATEWRALQRTALQAMIDRTTDPLYELFIDPKGYLVVRSFDSSKFADDESKRRSRDDNLRLTMFSPFISSYHRPRSFMHDARRIKRGVGGRGPYDPDDILAAGLRGEPGYRPCLETLKQAGDKAKVLAAAEERTVVDSPPNADINPQHASLARLIAGLDALRHPYEFFIDENGSLAVHILYPRGSIVYYLQDSCEERVEEHWYERFYIVIDAEADWVDAYIAIVENAEDLRLRRVAGRRPEDILAAGLSERPRRFQSREAELEWHPRLATPPHVPLESSEKRRALQILHCDDWESDAWRAIQRTKLQELLDRLDSSEVRYELIIWDGCLKICTIRSTDPEGRTWSLAQEYSAYFYAYAMPVRDWYNCRRVKRGVAGRGRYNPEDIIAAGLGGRPDCRTVSDTEKEEFRKLRKKGRWRGLASP